MDADAKPRLSVLLITYNHERYIGRALESLASQDYEGPIELVVSDDHSTDATVNQIERFGLDERRFHLRVLPSTHNLGITRNYERGFAACSAERVAVLEGDDYWISPTKLRIQMAFLDEHLECNGVATNYFIYDEARYRFRLRKKIEEPFILLGARDFIKDNLIGNFSTCMYRRSALERLPAALFSLTAYDWIINICLARDGLIGFLSTPMVVYRIHPQGAWAGMPDRKKREAQLEIIPTYDALTDHVFHSEFRELERQIKRDLANKTLPGRIFRIARKFRQPPRAK